MACLVNLYLEFERRMRHGKELSPICDSRNKPKPQRRAIKKTIFILLGIASGVLMIYLSIDTPDIIKKMVAWILRPTFFICGVVIICKSCFYRRN